MRLPTILPISVLLLLPLVACGGDTTQPESPRATSIVVLGPDSAMVGDTFELTARVRDQNGDPMSGQTVEWTSSDEGIVTVTATGTVHAMGEGSARVTATAAGVRGGMDVAVWARPVPAAVEVVGPDSLLVGETVVLQATIEDQYGSTMGDAAVEWISSDPSVLVVSPAGEARAVSAGTADVTAAADGASGTLAVRVYPVPMVELVEDTIVLVALGDSARATGTVGGTPVDVELSLLEERRWNRGLPVSRATDGTVTAAGAGMALYLASATSRTSASPDTLAVRVEPGTPYVFAMEAPQPVGPESPILLRGFGLGRLSDADVSAAGEAAGVVALDSATLRVAFEAVPEASCQGARAALEIAGADVLADDLRFRRQRIGAIDLQPGETRRLALEEAECLEVEGPDSAVFAVAYYDARYAYVREAAAATDEPFNILLADLSLGEGAAVDGAPPPIPELSGHGDPRPRAGRAADGQAAPGQAAGAGAAGDGACGPEDAWLCETHPYQVGDQQSVTRARICDRFESVEVEVIAVIDDYLAVWVPVDSLTALGRAAFEPFLDQARQFSARDLPWIQQLFGGVRPAAPNGQYMVFGCPTTNWIRGWFGEQRMTMEVAVDDGLPSDYWKNYYRLAQFYAYSAFEDHRIQQAAATGTVLEPELWAWTGAVEMVAMRSAMEHLGFSASDEVGHGDFRDFRDAQPYYDLAKAGAGLIQWGYAASAAFGFDLAWRVAEASGLSWEEAHDRVTYAMAHDRYGCTAEGCSQYDGLYDVMPRHLGPDWDPVEAMLTFTASYALDDLVPSPVYRVPSIHRVTEFLTGGEPRANSLGPQVELVGYSGASVSVPGSGNYGYTTSIPAGSTGWVRLVGGGTAFQVTSDTPQLELMLIRLW